jgi:trehalose 6-phosphate synthase/phosphatase
MATFALRRRMEASPPRSGACTTSAAASGTAGPVTTSAPIQFLYRSVPREQLLALYRAADVMLVTPLRDGMNLVAKEYVASRSDERSVLVLSEFAGAATELVESLVVNPFDLGMVARAIATALSMAPQEQATRMAKLRTRARDGSVERWVERFLADLVDDRRELTGVAASASELHAC